MASFLGKINENDDDILIRCFKNKLLEKAKVLLNIYPAYFKENQEFFQRATQCLDTEKKAYLANFLQEMQEEDSNQGFHVAEFRPNKS